MMVAEFALHFLQAVVEAFAILFEAFDGLIDAFDVSIDSLDMLFRAGVALVRVANITLDRRFQ